jgi:hypothetical protein
MRHGNIGVYAIAICMFLLLGCGTDRNEGKTSTQSLLAPGPEVKATGVGSMSINFKFTALADMKGPRTVAKLAATDAISNVTAYMYKQQTGAELAQKALTISGGIASGLIMVPAPDTVRVVVVFYDGSIVRWAGEMLYVSIIPDRNTPVTMTVVFQGIMTMAMPINPTLDTPINVNWYSTPFSTSFELWESTTPVAGSGSPIYTGASFTYQVPGKAAAGTFYYSTRAITQYGMGPFFSNGIATVTVTEKEQGGVDVTVPVPPDEPQ